jgi:PBSX family phage terminase large subunit
MALSQAQQNIATADKRFRVLISGRRFGKTHLAIREMCKAASQPNQKVWYVSPSYRMSKQIVWQQLKKKLIELKWAKKVNESEMNIWLVNGSEISLKGADNEQSLRGVGLDFIVLDEFADINQKAWTEVLRPTLSDTGGSALFCGTPKGIGNWAYDLYQQSNTDPKNWESFQYTTLDGGQVPAEEIEQAKNDLDERTFRQEYEASFETYSGQVYYNYGAHNIQHNKPQIHQTILVGMDFNISPMSACIAQRTEQGITIFDEIVIYGSNTDEMVQEIKTKYPDKQIIVYPDSASRQRKTSAGGRTDLSILQNAGFQTKTRPSNPPVRDRINAVNSALKSANNTVKLMITPNCKNVIKSLSRQIYKEGTNQSATDGLEHMADAVGYLVEYIYPVKRNSINNNKQLTWSVMTT